MKITYLLRTLLCICFLWPLVSFGMQYRVQGSPERHEIALGVLGYPITTKSVPKKEGFFLDYSFYFNEVHKFSQNRFKSYGQIGIEVGANSFDNKALGNIKDVCANQNQHPLWLYAGSKLRVSYLENIIPFLGYGWAIPKCSSKLSRPQELKSLKVNPSSSSLNRYFSVGLNISLKLFDKASVYVLDEDYGINDTGIHLKCMLFSAKQKNSNSDQPWLCQAGLSLLF